ncbi:MAG: hypothetical protein M3R04_00865, partial [bacterium]|nr:hypothetical protein [bacterium]
MHNLLTLNLTDALTSRRLADGTTFADAFARLTQENADIHERLLSYKDEWPLGWLDLDERHSELNEIKKLKEKIRAEQYCDGVAVFGIGGSALGTQAVLKSLDWNDQAGIDIFDNVDPCRSTHLTKTFCWDTTYLNVISKSGTTLETMAWFLHGLEQVYAFTKESPFEGHIIATTDASNGVLRTWAEQENWTTLPVPNDIGGRFSVFTPVGLFPLAVAGVDIEALLHGAATWQTSAVESDLLHNEAWQLA